MWFEILCGLFFYKFLRRCFVDADTLPEIDNSVTDALFAVSERLEESYGGKAFVGLRIPDAETGTRQHVDLVLVTKREMKVVAVRPFSGVFEIANDGSWVSTNDAKGKPKTHPDPVLEVNKQVSVLESYLEQRGVSLPKGHMVGKVILPNPKCRPVYAIESQPEVISFEKWKELKPFSRGGLSNWIKDAVHGGKGDVQNALYKKLQFILSTSPMWDRLELKGGRFILGEFLEFKGNQDDMQALKNLKRSKVGQFFIQKSTLFGFGRPKIQIMYSSRDYRSEGNSSHEWKNIALKSSPELLFQPLNSKKTLKLKLSSIDSITLST